MADKKKSDEKKAPPPAGPLPTVAIPKVVDPVAPGQPQPSALQSNTPQKTGVALPPKVATAGTTAELADMPAEPIERRVYTLHALVVQQALQIGTLRSELAELKKRIDDFNTRSAHKI
jgi:hypothetical protein